MRWIDKLSNNIKKGIRSWLNIQPASPYQIQIQETMDFELNAIRNRIWYRGDGNELEQMYMSAPEYADRYKFWASKSSPGMEMRKIHSGVPSLIVKTLSNIVLTDLNDFKFDQADAQAEVIWHEIERSEHNKFRRKIKRSLHEALYIGDGAWKVSLDTVRSEYPILNWYPGDRIELVYQGDYLQEIIFKTPYKSGEQQYVLHEHYGHGYIHYKLYRGEQEVSLSCLHQTRSLFDWSFDEGLMLAVYFKIFENSKYENRGGSIFDAKLDNFDALDEAWSQWMDALRKGRAKTYIPDCLIPRDPADGHLLRPNPFDNAYIATGSDMSENGGNKINTEQPAIPHDSYLATYVTALDLCLQGLISPSTLGIDVKKLDNAEAQREKEKATLYTRNTIVDALQETLPELVNTCLNALHVLHGKPIEQINVEIPFGEYANPSFESQVETVGKGKTQGIMSIEACVEELYGDSKDDVWKAEEIARLKAEQGITEVEEPGLNLEGVSIDESNSGAANLSDVTAGISRTPEDSV